MAKFLLILTDDDYLVSYRELSDEKALFDAVACEVFGKYDEPPELWITDEETEEIQGIVTNLIEDGKHSFEGDQPLYCFKLRD